jgi:hypothetical protein
LDWDQGHVDKRRSSARKQLRDPLIAMELR